MPVMSGIERAFCRSALWRLFARRAVLPWALDGHPLSGHVLEIGGGSGAIAAGVVRSCPDSQFTMTDVDAAMVQSARVRLAHYPNDHVQVADVTSLPFVGGQFDAVTSYLMLHHTVYWADALAEVLRVLAPGGSFIGYDFTNTRLARWIHQADGSRHRLIVPDELAHQLVVRSLTEIVIRPTARGHLMRFRALQPSGP